MRTNFALVLILAFGLTGMMFSMSGMTDILDHSYDSQVADDLNQSADGSSINQGFNASASAQDEGGSIVGFAISGAEAIAGFLGLVVLFPFELADLGFPWWFAYPLGVGTQIIASIGLVQFASNRVLR